MCRQFPYLVAHGRMNDRVSVNYGCPAVQTRSGAPLKEQVSDIAGLVPRSERSANPKTSVALDNTHHLTPAEFDGLLERAMSLFDEQRSEDVWTRFANLLGLLVAVRECKANSSSEGHGEKGLVEMLRSGQPLPDTPTMPEILACPKPGHAPMPARFLFAATLCPDTMPRDSIGGMGFKKRVTLIPRLLTLATLTGTYPSSLLGRNASIDRILAHEVDEDLDTASTQLLCRYFRSRLWQHYLAGTRLSVIAGVHQHIHDFNAIVLFARAEAEHGGESRLTHSIIERVLTGVEFHFANQARLFQHSLKKWLRTQLQRPELAIASLRLMALTRPMESVVATPKEHETVT
jgi:hypothetical protein